MARYSRRVSDYQYPDDEFDAADAEGPVPVGVHRAQVPAWRSWIPLLAVLIIVPLVAWAPSPVEKRWWLALLERLLQRRGDDCRPHGLHS